MVIFALDNIGKQTITVVKISDWGLTSYKDAFEKQEELFLSVIDQKVRNRTFPDGEQLVTDDHFIFCEHPHVITLGKSGEISNLLLNEKQLAARGIEFFKTTRGGDITYHGPGQIVGYPILDLEHFDLDIKNYIFLIEEMIIRTLAEYHIESGRMEAMTGVWLDAGKPAGARKICAIGVKASRHVTMHGFAFNINTQLEYFNTIVPCGIQGKAVTSLSKELGRRIDIEEVKPRLVKHFETLFHCSVTDVISE